MRWQNISTVNFQGPTPKEQRPPVLLSIFGSALLGFSLLSLGGCASVRSSTEPAAAGVPETPVSQDADASLESLRQGLQYVREHPSTREDERIQRFLWLDQWTRVLQDKGRLAPEKGQEYWGDLTAFVKDEPPLSAISLDRMVVGSQTKLGKNVASYQAYQTLLKDQSLESALKKLEAIEEDGISDLFPKAQGLLQLFKNKTLSDSRKIGVLLPLSGDLKPLAEEALTSIQMVSQWAYANGIEFVIEDTGTTEADLQRAWQKLAVEEKVSVIMGPLTSRESELVFERAEIMSIPVVSLAPKEGLEGFGKFGFRSVLTLGAQVRRIADFLAKDMKLKRVAILLPDSRYGWDVIAAAQKEFNDKGLQVTQIQVYPQNATDFKEPLRRMTRLDIKRLRKDEVCPKEKDLKPGEVMPEGCVRKLEELKPLVDFDVIFAPDAAESIGLLLPTLPYLRLYGVQVVGLSLYNSPRLLERAGESAEGVIFTDGYLSSATDFQTKFFREQYKAVAKKEPSRLAAEAYDLASVLAKILHDGGGLLTREGLVEKLRGVKDFPGVTGSIYYDSQKLQKEPKLLVVRNGAFQELRR